MLQNSEAERSHPLEEKKESYFGANFLNHGQSDVNLDAINAAKIVCLFFGAQRCPACKAFLPLLVEFYKEVNFDEPLMEVMYVASDETDAQFNEFFGKMPWKAIPLADERTQRFKNMYGVIGIPKLVVLTAQGAVVTKEGRTTVVEKGENAWLEWLEQRERLPSLSPVVIAKEAENTMVASTVIDNKSKLTSV